MDNYTSEPNIAVTHDKGFSSMATEATELIAKYFYACIVLIGVPGNAFVILLFRGKSMSQSIGHIVILMKSLALMDLIACGSMLFFNVFPEYLSKYMNQPILCNIFYSSFIFWGSGSASGYHMLMIGIERYIGIVFPIWHRNNINKKHMYIMCLISWFMGFVVVQGWITVFYQYKNGTCVFLTMEFNKYYRKTNGIVLLICNILIPVPAIAFCYFKIYCTIIKKDLGDASKAVLKTLVITIVTYMVCWTPNQVTWLLYTQGYDIRLDGVWYNTTGMLVSVNSCLNFIIYFINIKVFRRALLQTVTCGKVKNEASQSKSKSKTATKSKQIN